MKKTFAIIFSIVLGMFVLTGFSTANAVNPSTTPSSITLNQVSPSLGDWVTFTTVYPKNTKNPRVQVMCYQGDILVWATADHPDAEFLLGGASSDWLTNGGEVECRADLFSIWWTPSKPQEVEILASTFFHAEG